MTSSYVCNQCRARLLRHAASLRSPRWQPKATFLSLRPQPPSTGKPQEPSKSNPAPQDLLYTDTNEGKPNQDVDRELSPPSIEVLEPSRPQYRLRDNKGPGTDQTPRVGRYSRYTQGVFPKSQAPNAETLENTEISGHSRTEAASPSGSRIPRQESGKSYAQPISKDLNAGNLNAAWARFLQGFGEKDSQALTQPSFQDLSLLQSGKVFGVLLESIVKEFCKGNEVPVAPSAVLFKYTQVKIQRPEFWLDTIERLTLQTLSHLAATPANVRKLETILAELMAVWRLFFQCKSTKGISLQSIDEEWHSIPSAEVLNKLTGASYYWDKDFSVRLQKYHSNFHGHPTIGFSAVVIFNLFDEQNPWTLELPESLRTQNTPFIKLLEHTLAGASLRPIFRKVENTPGLEALPKEFRDELLYQIKSAPSKAMAIAGVRNVVDAEPTTPGSRPERESTREGFLLKRISRAILEKADKRILESLWNDAIKAYTPRLKQKPAIPPAIYNSFLTGFMALYQADRTVDVWNHMIAHGVKPDVKSWAAMLTGCEKARDVKGLNQIWVKMLQSGVQPDVYAWTARVHGLFTLRKMNEGFAALEEIGKTWLAAEAAARCAPTKGGDKTPPRPTSKAINTFPKPSIEVINAAITAIATFTQATRSFPRRIQDIQRILHWAGAFSLKPDATTYNTIIRLSLANSDNAMTFKLLRQMEAEGIDPDLATFTMLLGAAFQNQKYSNLSADEQASQIILLLEDLEKRGLKLNAYIYSSSIDKLLKQYSNFTAVRTVIDHMLSRNLIPSPHIYTSLITHYFQDNPANIPAVDSLWLQIMNTPGTPTDKILFDRVIEGYASVGEVGKMMTVLVQMSKHGKLPGWTALRAVVTALVESGDWERARSVVSDVQNGEGVAKGGITGGAFGSREFWEEVKGLGLGQQEERREDGEGIEAAQNEATGQVPAAVGW
ncbi:hypothetical protein K469DRAFT_706366 [Zopfia rhizophila CBS 207.26]|uniref:Pentacotripeptide-repeat region of PRORP domain-containing protein n=1 Tax=Zopfia rhizophila CBS 207.26 TaxID=1314779 RepID=A0A6A6EYB5_9PEZI|nr:hypothetical protein K469DRAFT_706366 [Zopfia rhizophila CBS 207.26]